MTASTQASRLDRYTQVRNRRVVRPAVAMRRVRAAAEVAALVMIVLLLLALPILSRSTTSPTSDTTTKVVVRPGDTLWSVALAHPLPGMTTAETADRIAALNGNDSSRIPVGSSIIVPVDEGSSALVCK